MLNPTFRYLGIFLLALSTSQCFTKCKVAPTQDTTQLRLKWEEEAKPLDVPGLDLSQVIKGKTCYVPSEEATYLVTLQGQAWKFIRTSAGNLEAQALNNLPLNLPATSTTQEFFVFAAGSKEQQALFVGKIVANPTFHIKLWKYASGNWKEISQTGIRLIGAGNLFPQANDAHVLSTSCSLEGKDQIYGCVIVSLQEGANFTTGILVFDPTTEQFKAITPPLPRSSGQHPWLATSPVPNKVILGTGIASGEPASSVVGKLDLISTADNKASIVKDKDIKASKNAALAGLCCLQLADSYPIKIQEPIFFALENNAYKFLRADDKNNLVSAGDLPSTTLDKKTLILPFSHELYCLTTQTADGKAQTVYYYAQLELAPKEATDKKP